MVRAILLLCLLNAGCVLNEKQPRVDHDVMYFDDEGHYTMTEHYVDGRVTISR